MQLILLSGLSGSGKSVALKALEDAGYFTVDNLPAALIPALLDTIESATVAISVDVRAGQSISVLPELIIKLRGRGIDCRVIFLDARDDALARRFAETRRPHPLAERIQGGVAACIAEERRMLDSLAEMGHRIDTSDISPNTLRAWIKDWLKLDRLKLTLAFQSFGFKHGVPLDADLIFDARFLPNPYYDPALRPLTGRDAPVQVFLAADQSVAGFIDDVAGLLAKWLPAYVRDNRAALTIGIGCTGGQHRSVYIVEQLAERFGASQQVIARHRDIAERI